jgi:hypothetical protein
VLSITDISQALIDAYQAMSNLKEQVYEITGISDIIRGSTVASETATAQQIKGQYATLRLKSMQDQVAQYATALIRLKAQIICTKYQPHTLLSYAAADQLNDADKQLVPQALQLIRNNPLRMFRIEVSADSLVQMDEMQNKQDRVEFITALGGFMEKALPVGQQVPEMAPAIVETMKFAIAGFKQSRPIEGMLDQALDQLKAKAAASAGQPPPPNPDMMKIQAQQQTDAARLQADTAMEAAKTQGNLQVENVKAGIETQRMQMEDAFERWKVDQETARAIMVARIAANPGADIPILEAEQASAMRITQDLEGHVSAALGKIDEAHQNIQAMHQQTADMHGQVLNKLHETAALAAAPKRVVRDAQGRVARVEVVPPGGATLQ